MASPPLDHRNEDSAYRSQQAAVRGTESMARASTSTPQRLRNECESWVEISSQPSSSSLSSIGDEIVLTGLHVQHDPTRRRIAKRPRNNHPSHLSQQTRQFSHSSQEEYDESESEDDHVLTSSNEHLSPRPSSRPTQLSAQQQTYHTSDDDEDENGTALGVGRARTRSSNAIEQAFTPQPNAFSHPMSSQRNNPTSQPAGSYFPRTSTSQPQYHRHSYSGRSATSRQQHTPFSGTSFSPSSQDHDAALRASLTTLLSCAAAARGLPKRNNNSPNQNQPWMVPHPSQPANQEPSGNIGGLRLVPESELLNEEEALPLPRRTSNPSTNGVPSPVRTDSNALEKGKRKSQNQNSIAKEKERVIKKKRTGTGGEEIGYFSFGLGYGVVSPTFLTWVVSAGVVVLVGVVGFGAGYAIGREAGLVEGSVGAGGLGAGGGAGSGSCAKEAVRGSSGGLGKIRMAITA